MQLFRRVVRGQFVDAAVLEITAGGTAQDLFALNNKREIFIVQNHSAGDLWVEFGATAVAEPPSIKIGPGELFTMTSDEFVDVRAISIIGATTGQAFSAKEF